MKKMAHIQFVDELVREYLLYRGFTSTVKAFEVDLKADKDKGFRVDKIVDQIQSFINVSDASGLIDYWNHLDGLVFSNLEIHFQHAIRKVEHSIYKLYIVIAIQNSRSDKVSEFLTRMLPELQGQNEWKDWFMLRYIQKPEENPSFSMYFTKHWQDTVLVTLHNFLATVFQCIPQPTLANYEGEVAITKKLQDELTALKNQTEKSVQPGERLSGPQPLIDDFYAVPSDVSEGSVREAKGLRGLIRQMGGSPVLGKKVNRSFS